MAVIQQPHTLEHSWTFWFDNPFAKLKQATWGSSMRSIYTFSTVEEFWRIFVIPTVATRVRLTEAGRTYTIAVRANLIGPDCQYFLVSSNHTGRVALQQSNMASLQAAGADLESSETPIFSSVQELTKNYPNITVPNRYLRLHQEPPNLFNGYGSHHSTSIPTIDLESLLSKEETEFQLEKLHAICKEWGIFQLVNHGVGRPLLEKLKHEMLEYYKLPVEEKMRYKIRPGDAEGCGTVARTDGKHDWGDGFYMITNPIHRRKSHLLPELPSSLRKTLESYFLELQKLGIKLIGMMGKAVKNMDSKEFEEKFEDGMQAVRLSYYPPCPKPEVVMGLTPHTDSSGITILNQVNGVDGLEIKKDGIWIPVRFLPDALVVNVGDILEIMSNGVCHSVEQATVNSEKERISIAFFISPKFEVHVGPVVTDIINPPLFKTVEEYLKTRFSRKIDEKSYLDYMKIENENAAF